MPHCAHPDERKNQPAADAEPHNHAPNFQLVPILAPVRGSPPATSSPAVRARPKQRETAQCQSVVRKAARAVPPSVRAGCRLLPFSTTAQPSRSREYRANEKICSTPRISFRAVVLPVRRFQSASTWVRSFCVGRGNLTAIISRQSLYQRPALCLSGRAGGHRYRNWAHDRRKQCRQ